MHQLIVAIMAVLSVLAVHIDDASAGDDKAKMVYSNPEFYEALKSRDVEKIKKIVDEKPMLANINIEVKRYYDNKFVYKHERPPIVVLALNGFCDTDKHSSQKQDMILIKYLLSKGADVNKKEKPSGITALMAAGYRAFYPLYELLVKSGANVNQADAKGATPLIRLFASCSKMDGEKAAIARLLIDHGANVNVIYTKSPLSTPLHWAVDKKLIKSANVLLKAGANPRAKPKGCATCETPMDIARKLKKRGRPEFLALLLRY